MCDVTVVISNFNYEKYVSDCIRSVLNQSKPCKVIVVDDASTDSSWSKILDFKKDITAVRLKENSRGNARGKNVGICLSTTKYITCFDSDDLMPYRSIEHRYNCSVRKKSLFCFGVTCPFESSDLLDLRQISEKSILKTEFANLSNKNKSTKDLVKLIRGTSVLADRCLYEKYGLFDEKLRWRIDKEMWTRWIDNGILPSFVRQYVVLYRKHADSATARESVGDFSLKDREVNDRYTEALRTRREGLSRENTLFIDQYSIENYVEKIS